MIRQDSKDIEAQSAERRAGALLVVFVVLQLVYLFLLDIRPSPPALDGPMSDIRVFFQQHAMSFRALPLLALFNFVAFFIPGSLGLRRRLARSTRDSSLGPALLTVGVSLIMISVFMMAAGYAFLGVLPMEQLDDGLLRATIVTVEYCGFGVGSFATALYLGAASLAILDSQSSPRWLGWWGSATALASLAGSLWIVSANVGGPAMALSLLARGSFLLWVGGAGVWLHRNAPRDVANGLQQDQPLSTAS